MTQQSKFRKPAALAIGATFAVSMAASTLASAAGTHSNPFAMSDLPSGYTQLAEKAKDGKCGEGKCSVDKKKAEKKAEEGKCGADKAKTKATPKEGKCGAK
ncbi:MAG: low-complexity protein [Gammaproteobacteria bacterium]|nr:low-complexity protein [Gammaproteobacteria bacterium]